MIRRFIVPVAGLALVMSLPAAASAADTAFAARAVAATGPGGGCGRPRRRVRPG